MFEQTACESHGSRLRKQNDEKKNMRKDDGIYMSYHVWVSHFPHGLHYMTVLTPDEVSREKSVSRISRSADTPDTHFFRQR